MSTRIEIECPAGTSGLAVAPWSRNEVYAVAADWRQAASPVWVYGERGWRQSGRQVADYRHSERRALRSVIVDAIAASEGISTSSVDDDEVSAIMSMSQEIE